MEEKTGKLTRALAGGRRVRVLGLDLTEVAMAMCEAHKLAGPSAQLAAEALVATTLMSGQIKGEERLTLQIRFDNLSASFMGEIDADNNVRGMMRPARLRWQEGEVLKGAVLAIKHSAEKELYRGVTTLEHKSIESALVAHLETSNQLDVIVRIGSVMSPQGRPSWVGGVVVERLPDEANEGTWFEESFGALRHVPLPAGLERLQDGWLLEQEHRLLPEEVLLAHEATWRWSSTCISGSSGATNE